MKTTASKKYNGRAANGSNADRKRNTDMRVIICPKCGGYWHASTQGKIQALALEPPEGAQTKYLPAKAVDKMNLCMCPWVE